jgi:hypothetical protein
MQGHPDAVNSANDQPKSEVDMQKRDSIAHGNFVSLRNTESSTGARLATHIAISSVHIRSLLK